MFKILKWPNIKNKRKRRSKVIIKTFLLQTFINIITIYSEILKLVIKTIYKLIKQLLYKTQFIWNLEVRVRIFSLKALFTVLLFTILYAVSVFYITILNNIPSPDRLMEKITPLTTNIYDRKGNLLYKIYTDEDRYLVQLKDIPDYLIKATIAIEDQNFYKHRGLSFRGILRAAKRTFLDQDLEGGSTITQQLVKNAILPPHERNKRTYTKKLREVILAVQVELQFTKNEILQMYLNEIPYGGTAYGVQAAALKYFGKNVSDLTLAESALLAGLPVAPAAYSPFGPRADLAKNRQKDVLNRMVTDGYITQDEANKAYEETLNYKKQTSPIKHPHFVNYIKSVLVEKYGQKLVEQGGLDVYTTIDPSLQRKLEEIVGRNVTKLKRKNHVTNGAAMITKPKTGEILAMVGSADYWDIENDGNVNVAVSPRQPGSAIKPLIYSLALENGYNITTNIFDTPISYPTLGQKPYAPINYDSKFHGKVTLKTALANSYNVPAVKILNSLGIPNFIKHAKQMGITTWNNSSRYGLSLALGAGEVKMTDITTAYGIFANYGYRVDLNPILKVYDPYGNILESNECVKFLQETPTILTRKITFEAQAAVKSSLNNAEQNNCKRKKVISEETAYLISYILSDNKARVPAFGQNSALNITNKQVAVKTGTTSNIKDNWAIGYTNDYVVAAWVGNNNGDQMKNIVSGYRGASIIWREAIDHLIENRDIKEKIPMPEGIIEVDLCPITNTLACNGCPKVTQLFKKGEEPTVACNTSMIKKILEIKENEKNKEN